MKAQHTPGPWHMPVEGSQYLINAREKRRSFPVADDKTGGAVARIEWRPQDGEQEANARLIAAAPKLLQGCQRALHWIRPVGDPDAEFIREAIAEATVGGLSD